MLGGVTYDGLSAYVEDYLEFETNREYAITIEKKAESFYRVINQERRMLPASNIVIRQNLLKSNSMILTPQESEQLSIYASDDVYVKKQKQDIEELTRIYKEMLEGAGDNDSYQEFIPNLKENFCPMEDFKASYAIDLTDINKTLVVEVDGSMLNCYAKAMYLGKITFDFCPENLRQKEMQNFRSLIRYFQINNFIGAEV